MVWGNFFGNISFILGGLDPCPDGLGHFFGDEVPQSARLSAGGGVQKLFGQCPNARNAIYNGASLRLVGPQGLVCGSPTRCGPGHESRWVDMFKASIGGQCVLRKSDTGSVGASRTGPGRKSQVPIGDRCAFSEQEVVGGRCATKGKEKTQPRADDLSS